MGGGGEERDGLLHQLDVLYTQSASEGLQQLSHSSANIKSYKPESAI